MTDEQVRRSLLRLPSAHVPDFLTTRLRVLASHERQRRLHRFGWASRLWLEFNNLLRPLAVPATGGLISTLLLFTALADTLDIRRYVVDDVPLGIYTQVTVANLSPFAARGEDLMVEVTIDENGQVSDFQVPSGKVSGAQLRDIGNLLLYSSFSPATAYGHPVSGKILVSLHHINVRG